MTRRFNTTGVLTSVGHGFPRNRTRALALAAITLLATLGLVGCDKEDGRAKPGSGSSGPTASTTTPGGATAGKGVIRGVVKFSGTRPELKPKQVPCHNGGALMNIADETVLIGAGDTLQNAVVYLKNPPAGASGPAHASPVIDQKNCTYVPHVAAAQTGQTVTFTSSDDVLHNVHTLSVANGEVNKGINLGGTITYPVNAPGYVTVKCDVHPWMQCRIAVFDHGFFAVTGADGKFEFAGLPPGTYEVGVWHEKLKQATQDVAVDDAKPADVTLTVVPK